MLSMLSVIPEPLFLMDILKGLFLINPASIVMVGGIILIWLSLKTLSAKLLFLSGGLILTTALSYYAYRQEKKAKLSKSQKKEKILNFEDFALECPENTQQQEEKELMLSKIFKK